MAKRLAKESAERAISLVLRGGSLAATVVMAAGLVLTIARGPAPPLESARRTPVALLPRAVARLHPVAVTELGVFLLILTPIVRVLVAVVMFALERDVRYVLISLGVLAILLISMRFAVG